MFSKKSDKVNATKPHAYEELYQWCNSFERRLAQARTRINKGALSKDDKLAKLMYFRKFCIFLT